MIGLANTTVSVLRGTSFNDAGDEIDGTNAVATGQPAAFSEVGTSNKTEASDTPGTTRRYTVRVARGLDVREGDRLLDERTGEIFTVGYVRSARHLPELADRFVSVSRTD